MLLPSQSRLCVASAAARFDQSMGRPWSRPVHIAGVIGPGGDAYRPEESLSAGQAREYHGL